MSLYRISFSFFILVLFAGCAIFSKLNFTEKEKLLIEHLDSWKNFTADGIVTVNYQNFVFRKNINIIKNADSIKLTIYDSGIFGMKPEPFLSVMIDSLVHLKTQDSEETAIFALDQFPGIDYLLHPMQFLKFKNKVISESFLGLTDGTSIQFSEEMKMIKIEQESKEFSVDFFYESNLSKIQVWQNNIELIKIEIDKITRKQD